MKNLFTTLCFFLFTSLFFDSSAQQVIYVNQADSLGANDGSGWGNAYTDLQVALDSANTNDIIWVAQGTYKPGDPGSAPTESFRIAKDMVLLGGYKGSGPNADDRNPQMYESILSGDLNGDDEEDDFENHRDDNVMRVMSFVWGISSSTTIDGFTIRNGHAVGATTALRRGAGINASNAAPLIKDCFFTQNYALNSGAGLFLNETQSQGALVQNCRFEKNRADAWTGGAGLYVLDVAGEGVRVENSTFDSNEGGRGSGLSCYGSNLVVNASSFLNNTNEQQGGGLWFWGEYANRSLVVDGCTFSNNHSSFGGGVYINPGQSNNSVDIKNTDFIENEVSPNDDGWGQNGGGIFLVVSENVSGASITIDDCQFTENISSSSGGGISVSNNGDLTSLDIKHCEFTRGSAVYHGGGLQIFMGETANETTILVDSCHFEQNQVDMWTGGGFRCLLQGYENDLTLSNSTFLGNNSGLAGGGAGIYAFSTISSGSVRVLNCSFDGNESDFEAGLGIGSSTDAGYFEYIVSNSDFQNNSAINYGGGLAVYSERPAKFTVEDCVMTGNTAGASSGGFFIENTHPETEILVRNCKMMANSSPFGSGIGSLPYAEDSTDFMVTTVAQIVFENCLMANNSGDGGTVGLKQTGNVEFLNCTIAENPAGGIKLDSTSAVTLQNTILFNPDGIEYEVLPLVDDASITSFGGNLIGDGSLGAAAHPSDFQDVEESPFEEEGVEVCDYYKPSTEGMAFNNGVEWMNAPDFDLCGNPRVYDAGIDIGAIEWIMVSVKEVISEELAVSPNPATDFLHIQMPETVAHPIEASLFDFQGRLMDQFVLPENQAVEVGHLPSGMYLLKVLDRDTIYTGKFVKQ